MIIRKAVSKDVTACVRLVESRRKQYEQFEPRFWNKATNSNSSTVEWFGQLFLKNDVVSLVADDGLAIAGFLIAQNLPVPPVYDPGGATALIDDFCVISKSRWNDVGSKLLDAARSELSRRGFIQIVVVGADKDRAKMEFLSRAKLSLTSTWWTSALE